MKKKILIIIFILLLFFILANSLMNPVKSEKESAIVLNLLSPVINAVWGEGAVSLPLLRKIAHFAEYTCLGLCLAIILGRKGKRKKPRALFDRAFGSLSIGLLVAVIDETIQNYSGRDSNLLDVWLDFSGVITGVSIIILILFVYNRRPTKYRRD